MNFERELLMIPGPTMVSPRVLRVLSKPILSHGSKEFIEGFTEALELQKEIFMTDVIPFMLAGSGTLSMEATVANLVEKGDKILCVENGFFGEKWAEIVKAHGGIADRLNFGWRGAIDLKILREKLGDGDYKAVTIEHVDTSTGVANPIDKIGESVKDVNTLYIVDSVCGLGGMPLKMDEWNIDVCITGSQKALGAPPGMTMLCVNERAWKVIENRSSAVSDYYADLKRWRGVMDDPKKYFATPATGLVLGVLEALRIIKEEGLEARWSRHKLFSDAFKAGLSAMKLQTFPPKGFEAHTLSVPILPNSVKDSDLRSMLQSKYGVIIAGGIGETAGKVVRIGHMGSVTISDLTATLSALEMVLMDLGFDVDLGAGIGAAERILSRG